MGGYIFYKANVENTFYTDKRAETRLVEIEKNIEKGKDIQKLLEKAKSLSGKSEYQKVSLEQFSLVSDWYCYAVKALIARKDFVNDLDWMERALRRNPVTRTPIIPPIMVL